MPGHIDFGGPGGAGGLKLHRAVAIAFGLFPIVAFILALIHYYWLRGTDAHRPTRERKPKQQ